MQIRGHFQFPYPPEIVWRTMTDPVNLKRCVPGCEHFAVTGPYTYEATLRIGVAALHGTYSGTAQLTAIDEPRHCKLHVKGGGGPGRVETRASFSLLPENGGTKLYYDGIVHFKGLISMLPSAVLTPVAYRVVESFFKQMLAYMPETAKKIQETKNPSL